MELYSIVRVKTLLSPDRHVHGTESEKRQPKTGDVGTIVHVNAPGHAYVVESVDPYGLTVWLADFVSEELELISPLSGRVKNITAELSQVADDAKSAFGSLSPAQLNWTPDEKSWSVAQCMDHLITTHSQYFPLFKRLAAGQSKPTFWEKASPLSGFFGRFLIKSLDPANLKKMKAPGKAQPSASEISGHIVESFYDHQRQIVEHLQNIPSGVDPVKTIITSPLLGIVTYSLDDCYTILVAHCQRHVGQAQRVTEHDRFPN